MVQLIVGKKGKGKTKYLLDKVNSEVKNVSGNIVYLDKSTKHMFELNNKVRLIDVSDYAFEFIIPIQQTPAVCRVGVVYRIFDTVFPDIRFGVVICKYGVGNIRILE